MSVPRGQVVDYLRALDRARPDAELARAAEEVELGAVVSSELEEEVLAWLDARGVDLSGSLPYSPS